jgi:hypothetical protein
MFANYGVQQLQIRYSGLQNENIDRVQETATFELAQHSQDGPQALLTSLMADLTS